MRATGRVLAVAAFTATLAGCGSASGDASRSATVTREEFGGRWPVTVERGVLRCEAGMMIVFSAGGEDYAVNGTARGNMRSQGWRDIEEIWAPSEDPEMAELGFKIGVGPFIERGLELCG